MRIFVPLLFLLFASFNLASGQSLACGFDQITNNQSLVNPNEEILHVVDKMDPWTKNEDTIKVIPVVVHVIHDGGGGNIFDAQLESQIRVLNEDYGKLPGTKGDGNGVNTEVRFFLANLDPNGNCTSGIVRINSPPDACQNMLTAGQKMRIHASLNNFRTLIWPDANLLSTGYDSVNTPPPIQILVRLLRKDFERVLIYGGLSNQFCEYQDIINSNYDKHSP